MGDQIAAMAAPPCGSSQGRVFFMRTPRVVKHRLNGKEHFHDTKPE